MCTLPKEADCCVNLCHINRNKALALSDRITSNFSLITFGTQLHQLRHVTGKKYQLKDHLVKDEESFLVWEMAECPVCICLGPQFSETIHKLTSSDPASQRWVCSRRSWSHPYLRSYIALHFRGFCVSRTHLRSKCCFRIDLKSFTDLFIHIYK